MPLTFTSVAGLLDLPDALFEATDVAADWGIGRICANTRFGALACEVFYGEYRDGDTVALPVSAVDGYHYSRDELVYGWMHKTTFDPDTGAPGGRGSFLLRTPSVDPLTGAVSSLLVYYVQGGAQTNTYDGLLAVLTFGVRGRGRLTMSAAPSFNDLADSAFAIDAAFKTLNATRLNRNAKLAAVRFELFSKSTLLDSKGFPQGYSNGQTVPLPVSPVDGYTYARAELKYLPFWIYTGKSNRSGPTGPGRIRLENVSVNTTTGVVTTQINYWNGTTETVTNDGIVGVLVLAQRAIGTMAAPAAAFTDLDDSLFFAGRVLGHTPLQTVNRNTKFSILRPEIFLANYTNGQTVALPTSPVDGYVYARNELDYLGAVLNTGAGQGGIRAESVRVNPATGLISAQVQFEKDGLFGGGIAYGYDATVAVVTVARRGHETELSDTPPLEPPAPPAPAPPTWIEFSGEDGLFYFELSTTESTGDPVYHEVQLASNSIFTTLLQTISLGTALHKNFKKPGVTRYARARSKFVGSDWSAWTAYGAPTAAFSGYPVDRYAPGGAFDPADRRFGNDVRQHDASGNPRHLFRYDDPTHTADLIIESATRSHVHPDAIDANRKVDLSKSGVLNKIADNIAESASKKWAAESGADITGSHQAATIAGQGGLATKSAVDLATAEVTNKNAGNITETAGRKWAAESGADITGSHQAATIAGQGALATKGSVDLATAEVTNKNLDNVADGTRVAWSSATQKAAAVDVSGNILLKNIGVVEGSTSGPVLNGDGTYQLVTDLSIVKTTKGNQVYLSFAVTFSITDGYAAYLIYFALFRDATRVSPEYCIQADDDKQYTATGIYIDSPSAASHTFTVKCKSPASTYVTLVGVQRSLSVIELG